MLQQGQGNCLLYLQPQRLRSVLMLHVDLFTHLLPALQILWVACQMLLFSNVIYHDTEVQWYHTKICSQCGNTS